MSPALRVMLPLVAIVAGVSLAIVAAVPRRVVDPPVAPVETGPRLWYDPNHPPRLTLPDGKRRLVLSLLNVRRPMNYGDYLWDDAQIPAGPMWIRVDLARQMLSVFRGGHEIGTAVILYGTDGKPTPTGTFPILEKAVAHRSTLYDAEMPHMLRLTNDGVAIHASTVRERAATHGCIGIPPEFAALLYAAVARGDVVAIMPPKKHG